MDSIRASTSEQSREATEERQGRALDQVTPAHTALRTHKDFALAVRASVSRFDGMLHLFVDLWHGAFPKPEPYQPPTKYVGLVKRIPADELPRIANGSESFVRINLEWDESPESFERRLAQDRWTLAPGGATEQIEALDVETGDLLVMWRAPCVKEAK